MFGTGSLFSRIFREGLTIFFKGLVAKSCDNVGSDFTSIETKLSLCIDFPFAELSNQSTFPRGELLSAEDKTDIVSILQI
jgi:hypothetical protein